MVLTFLIEMRCGTVVLSIDDGQSMALLWWYKRMASVFTSPSLKAKRKRKWFGESSFLAVDTTSVLGGGTYGGSPTTNCGGIRSPLTYN
jgi:hypothetical protein